MKVWPATVNVEITGGGDDGVGSEIVVLPIWNAPDWPRLILVPSTVCAAPPGEMVAPLRMKPVGLAMNRRIPMVKTD